ncbi:hypothetical protein LCGC14_2476280 [marine sediment metagenome]|uniref:Recombination endonuclease VII n=1 Tax=marine sediment metagenome TaxID=412755 RepID=A0A0F9E2Q4_9ZZZZ
MEKKICSECNIEKTLDCFSFHGSTRKDGSRPLRNQCRECRSETASEWQRRNNKKSRARSRAWRMENKARCTHSARMIASPKKRFWASLYDARRKAKTKGHLPCTATLDEIKSAFTGFCFVCGVPEIECKQRLCMDHCHETGRFRGWLCGRCNRASSYLGDSPQVMRILAEYIEQSQKSYSK